MRQGRILARPLFNTYTDCVLGIFFYQSRCKRSVGVVFDDAVFTELLEVLVRAVEGLREGTKPLGTEGLLGQNQSPYE